MNITFGGMRQTSSAGPSKTGGTLLAHLASQEMSARMHKRRVATTEAGALAIAQRITALRKARGITQVELAKRLDMSQALVSKYENGEVLVHAELLAQLATILNVSADSLLGLRRKRGKEAVGVAAPVVDKGLARRFALLGGLSRKDKETVARTIDALVAARGAGKAA
jgi:transcriptional regulator with XRE-family HTH domain